jgi:hypothetical protein
VSAKTAVFCAAALGVVGLSIYLFLEVRSGEPQLDRTALVAERAPAHSAPLGVQAREPGVVPQSSRPTRDTAAVSPASVDMAAPPPPSMPGADGPDERINLKLDNLMELANKAYDHQEFDQAAAIAMKVLAQEPSNVRMLRIVVSANCIQGDSAIAQAHYERLPAFDRDQMRTRCERYGVIFKEPPP